MWKQLERFEPSAVTAVESRLMGDGLASGDG
jgi:hypothetical protein